MKNYTKSILLTVFLLDTSSSAYAAAAGGAVDDFVSASLKNNKPLAVDIVMWRKGASGDHDTTYTLRETGKMLYGRIEAGLRCEESGPYASFTRSTFNLDATDLHKEFKNVYNSFKGLRTDVSQIKTYSEETYAKLDEMRAVAMAAKASSEETRALNIRIHEDLLARLAAESEAHAATLALVEAQRESLVRAQATIEDLLGRLDVATNRIAALEARGPFRAQSAGRVRAVTPVVGGGARAAAVPEPAIRVRAASPVVREDISEEASGGAGVHQIHGANVGEPADAVPDDIRA